MVGLGAAQLHFREMSGADMHGQPPATGRHIRCGNSTTRGCARSAQAVEAVRVRGPQPVSPYNVDRPWRDRWAR